MSNLPGNVSGLPAPDPAAHAHSERLRQLVREEIAMAGGRIPFARFMELALYAPGLGYYSSGTQKFAEAGDFITAPEISPLFSRCLARQCAELIERLGPTCILEFGAGSGTMAAVILSELAAIGRLPEAYWILEISGELRERQRLTLLEHAPGLVSRVRWLDHLPEPGFRGLVLANEVLDAMPVHLFAIDDCGPREGFIVCQGDDFALQYGEPAHPTLTQQVQDIERKVGPLPRGYRSEIRLGQDPWIRTVAGLLGQGAALFIDYGYTRKEYYHPQRTTGTLMCHYRHRAHPDPLILLGLQDITAYVDFTAAAETAMEAGLEIAGYTTQANFLMGCGLLEMVTAVAPGDVERHLELAQQVKRLTLPTEMGERFKALALRKGLAGEWMGFRTRDLRRAL